MEKKSNWSKGFFAALAGVAVGVAGKLLFDEITKPEEKTEKVPNEAVDYYSTNTGHKVTPEWDEYESFLCPIGQEVMNDPVITPHGISYERKNILAWLEKIQSCPITKNPLKKEDLISNYALKQAIEKYFKKKNNSKN